MASGAQQSGFPYIGAPVVDTSGVLTQPWYYLLYQIWQKLGGSQSSPETIVYGVHTSALEVTFYDSSTGTKLGHVTLTP